MVYLILSILTAIAMVLLFKYFERYRIDLFQAIVVNYYACLATGFILSPAGSFDNLQGIFSEPWLPYACLLGTLFIACFPLTGLSVQHNGTAVTTIAGRTSMVLPVAAAVWLYGDTLPIFKILGIALAILAVYLTTIKSPQLALSPLSSDANTAVLPNNPSDKPAHKHPQYIAILPLIIFSINGIIEITFNYAQKMLLPDTRHIIFTMSLFVVAGTIGTVILLYQLLRGQTQLRWQNVLGGIALGIPNYLSAYFFLRTLSHSGLQSSVAIPVNNIAVVLGSCVAAWFLFGEKLSRLNIIGIVLASIAIALIAA
jgi:drug/metabolite transporter (DMT)-like permease